MAKAYLLQNSYDYGDSRTIDPCGIIEVTLGHRANSVLSYAHQNQRLEVEFNRHNGMVESLTLLLVNDITICQGNFSGSTFIELEHTFAMGLDKNITDTEAAKQHIRIDQVTRTCIYDNAILFDIASEEETRFLFWNSDTLGIVTNKNFEITGFVFYNFDEAERDILSEFIQKGSIRKLKCDKPFNNRRQGNSMESNSNLIDNILKLINVSLIELLYYGLIKGIIDESFCVDFASTLLLRNEKKEAIWIEIAEMTIKSDKQFQEDGKNNRVLKLLENAIPDKIKIETKQLPYFNKIWFYLMITASLQDENLIKP